MAVSTLQALISEPLRHLIFYSAAISHYRDQQSPVNVLSDCVASLIWSWRQSGNSFILVMVIGRYECSLNRRPLMQLDSNSYLTTTTTTGDAC